MENSRRNSVAVRALAINRCAMGLFCPGCVLSMLLLDVSLISSFLSESV